MNRKVELDDGAYAMIVRRGVMFWGFLLRRVL